MCTQVGLKCKNQPKPGRVDFQTSQVALPSEILVLTSIDQQRHFLVCLHKTFPLVNVPSNFTISLFRCHVTRSPVMTIHQSCQLNKKHPQSLTGKAPKKSCLENYLIGKVTFQMLNFGSVSKHAMLKKMRCY